MQVIYTFLRYHTVLSNLLEQHHKRAATSLDRQKFLPSQWHWPLKITSEEQHLSRATKIYVAAWCCSTEVRQYTLTDYILSSFSSVKRNSLPDLPLTPREREILEKTSDLGHYDNATLPVSKSSDSVATGNGSAFEFPPQQLSPPPKPPLPQNAATIIPQWVL